MDVFSVVRGVSVVRVPMDLLVEREGPSARARMINNDRRIRIYQNTFLDTGRDDAAQTTAPCASGLNEDSPSRRSELTSRARARARARARIRSPRDVPKDEIRNARVSG